MNISVKRSLSRRAFLRGTGIALALPLLEAMTPAFAAAAPTKRRLVCLCTTLGIHGPAFFPEERGPGYKPSRYSAAIDELRSDFTILSGLSHPDVDGGHSSEASFLTAAPHPGSSGFKNTISLDQYAAEQLAPDTRFSSLVLSTQGSYGLSWTRGGVAIPADEKPSKVFAKLFLEGTPDEVNRQVRRLKDGQSIMDAVGERAKSLQRSVGAQDREKLDQYFTSVRELEQRLVKSEAWVHKPKPKVAIQPPTDPTNRADIIGSVRPLLGLVHLALQTDSSRIITLRLQGLNQVPPIDGVTQDWHNLSHHGKDPAKLEELAIIETAELKEIGAFLAKLKSTKEGEGSLLDETMVLYGSNLGNSSSHDTKNMPVLLAGGGFKHGQHLGFDLEAAPPLCNLYLQMLQRLGLEANAFASSKAAAIPGLGVLLESRGGRRPGFHHKTSLLRQLPLSPIKRDDLLGSDYKLTAESLQLTAQAAALALRPEPCLRIPPAAPRDHSGRAAPDCRDVEMLREEASPNQPPPPDIADRAR